MGTIVFLVASAVLAYELALMRMLLVASWHHFAFLVITIALLGFGASGTALCLGRRWILPRKDHVIAACLLMTAVSMPVGWVLVQLIPTQAMFLPSLLWRQLGSWLLYWFILTLPFFFGASVLGLALMTERGRQGAIYGANLLGSGLGVVLITLLMWAVPPQWLGPICAVPVWLGFAALTGQSRTTRLWMMAVTATAAGCWMVLDPPAIRADPYKYSAYLQRLERQGSIQRITTRYTPRSLVEVYRGEVFHDLPFLSPGVTPPPMDVVVIDGHLAASVLRITGLDDAAVMDQALLALPYDLIRPSPHVLLLDEPGTANIWLALRRDARTVDVVQPDANIWRALRDAATIEGSSVLEHKNVRLIAAGARHFVEHAVDRYELIQLVSLQGFAGSSGGMTGMSQDNLVTVQGITAGLRRLTDEGLMVACRGIQDPPRDNIKILSVFIAALKRIGVEKPADHVIIVRDFLGVCTIAKPTVWTEDQVARLDEICSKRELTRVWFPGIQTHQLNRPDELPGPPNLPGDWFHHAAVELFSPNAESFSNRWLFDIRPPTDDRPFFQDFFKFQAIGAQRTAYGELWLTRTEIAFLFVWAVMLVTGIAGAILTVVPLLLRGRPRVGKVATGGYFTVIGLAYLMLEIVVLSRLTHLMGDPVLAAAVVIATFLILSGLGSLTTRWLHRDRRGMLPTLIMVLLLIGVAELLILGPLTIWAGAWPVLIRGAVAALAIAPLAFFMGFPMPLALTQLDRSEPSLIPWAWGVNGFASVLAGPLATALGMTWGFGVAGAAALTCYGVAAVVSIRMPDLILENRSPRTTRG